MVSNEHLLFLWKDLLLYLISPQFKNIGHSWGLLLRSFFIASSDGYLMSYAGHCCLGNEAGAAVPINAKMML